MKIQQDILTQLHIEKYSIIRSFFSRRNTVYLIRALHKDGDVSEFVYKLYVSGNIEKEYVALCKLQGQNVPRVLACGHSALYMEYIRGKTLLERLEEAEIKGLPFEEHIDKFIGFLHGFYKVMPGHIYGDVNLRNFIVTSDGLWGVDLEESHIGRISTDIGKAAAFNLTYRPEFTDYKQQTASYLIEQSSRLFSVSIQEIEREKMLELEAMETRRMYSGEDNGAF